MSEVALFYLNDWLNYDWTSPGGGIGWTGGTTCVSGLVPPISLLSTIAKLDWIVQNHLHVFERL